jgi:GT2 family glycosyltransferase
MPDIASRASVLVGIATHNRAEILPKAIRSALDQSYKPIRVAVIDDASTDGTPSVRSEFPEIAWERRDGSEGYLRARNHLMLTANEDYYVSLDDDAWFIEGDEIAVAVELLERNKKVAAVAFDILSPDQPALRERDARSSVSLFIGCGHVLRLAVVKELGGYSEFPGTYGAEEKDLCLRLIDSGYDIVKLHGVHVWHDKTSTARDLARQHSSGVCNDMTLTMRRVPFGLLIPILCYKLVSHMVFAFKHGLLRSGARGVFHFALVAGEAWRSRRPVRPSSFARYQALTKSPVRLPVEL